MQGFALNVMEQMQSGNFSNYAPVEHLIGLTDLNQLEVEFITHQIISIFRLRLH